MTHCKLFIDFGYNPGNDRLPREAAACGCCLITSNLGAYKYYEDTPFPDEYKFSVRGDLEMKKIVEKVKEVLENY